MCSFYYDEVLNKIIIKLSLILLLWNIKVMEMFYVRGI